jgi:hypothetical protein
MRKFILIAAMVLASASVHAGESRNLTLAAGDEPTAVEPSKAVEAPKETPKAVEETMPAEAPKYVDRPAAITTATETPKTDAAKPVAAQTAKADKPKHRRYWTEARIIGELHRHGVYW